MEGTLALEPDQLGFKFILRLVYTWSFWDLIILPFKWERFFFSWGNNVKTLTQCTYSIVRTKWSPFGEHLRANYQAAGNSPQDCPHFWQLQAQGFPKLCNLLGVIELTERYCTHGYGLLQGENLN